MPFLFIFSHSPASFYLSLFQLSLMSISPSFQQAHSLSYITVSTKSHSLLLFHVAIPRCEQTGSPSRPWPRWPFVLLWRKSQRSMYTLYVSYCESLLFRQAYSSFFVHRANLGPIRWPATATRAALTLSLWLSSRLLPRRTLSPTTQLPTPKPAFGDTHIIIFDLYPCLVVDPKLQREPQL